MGALVAGLVLGGAASAALAQSDPASTTTSSTVEPTTAPSGPTFPTLPGLRTTTTTSPTTTAPAPGGGGQPPPDAGDDDSGPAEVPTDTVVVPPADGPAPPDPALPLLQQVAGVSIADAQRDLALAQAGKQAAEDQVASLTGAVTSLEARLASLESEKAAAAARLEQARLVLKRRAVASYVESPAASINQMLDATDFNDLTRKAKLVQSVVDADHQRVADYDAARQAAGKEIEQVVADLDAQRSALAVAASAVDGADAAFLAKQIQLLSVQAGGSVVGIGFVFPVAGPHTFADTFGAPRLFGTPNAHLHKGTDIFAAAGTPLLACERGVLLKVGGSDPLGGNSLWLVGASGTYYYYAHLSAYQEGIHAGTVLKAGDVVGSVGATGDAQGNHLHFEVHPNGGPAVDPYYLLKMVDDAQKQLAAQRGEPATPAPRS